MKKLTRVTPRDERGVWVVAVLERGQVARKVRTVAASSWEAQANVRARAEPKAALAPARYVGRHL